MVLHQQRRTYINLKYSTLGMASAANFHRMSEVFVVSFFQCLYSQHTWERDWGHMAQPWQGSSHFLSAMLKTILHELILSLYGYEGGQIGILERRDSLLQSPKHKMLSLYSARTQSGLRLGLTLGLTPSPSPPPPPHTQAC